MIENGESYPNDGEHIETFVMLTIQERIQQNARSREVDLESVNENSWYCTHVIMWARFKDSDQDHYPVWENVYLIQSDSDVSAFEQAESGEQC